MNTNDSTPKSPPSDAAERLADLETFNRLAQLDAVAYDRCRDQEAGRLGIRVTTLDCEVMKRRPKADSNGVTQGRTVALPDVKPWPEPVDGADVLDKVAGTIRRYVALPLEAADTVALWIGCCHAFRAFVHSPRLNPFSPEKGCGKTTLLDVIASLTPRPVRTESITAAVLFRLVDSQAPTLLLDECDTYLRDNEELRGLLNAGHKRGATALRCEGDKNEVRAFSAFVPAVLAGIGQLPGTLHDRSIKVQLVRAKPGEVSARFDSRHTEAETELCRKLARWSADNFAQLEAANPHLPDGAVNRLADNWRPLFAVAEIAGGDWPKRAKEAFEKLTSKEDADAQGIGMMLLADIREVFTEKRVQRLCSKELVESLCTMTDRPWPEVRKHGKEITAPWLAQRLKTFGIAPKTLRIGDGRAKGYELADFQEAFDRFLPPVSPVPNRDCVTSPENAGANRAFQAVTQPELVTAPKTDGDAANQPLSRCHGSQHPAPELVEEFA